MLKPDAKKKLKDLGFNVESLIEAIKADDEKDFELPEINHMSEDALKDRDENVKKEAKKEAFKEGKTAGIEIANKAIAKKFNLDNVDHSDPDKVSEALTTHFAKGDDATKEQVKLLQADVKRLQDEKKASDTKYEGLLFDQSLISMFPQNRDMNLTDNERLMLIKHAMEFGKEDDGTQIVKVGGQVIREGQTQNPVNHKKAIENYFNEKKWVSDGDGGGAGGRGGSDNPKGNKGGLNTMKAVKEQYKKDYPEKGGYFTPEFQMMVKNAMKDNPNFDSTIDED